MVFRLVLYLWLSATALSLVSKLVHAWHARADFKGTEWGGLSWAIVGNFLYLFALALVLVSGVIRQISANTEPPITFAGILLTAATILDALPSIALALRLLGLRGKGGGG